MLKKMKIISGFQIRNLYCSDSNEPQNAWRDFDDFPMDNLDASNDVDENVIYDDQVWTQNFKLEGGGV